MTRLVLAAAALAIAGCAPAASGIPPKGASVEGTRWQVTQVNGRAPPTSDQYLLTFENGSIGARFGCNHMGGPYRQAGNVIHPGPIVSTLMSCGLHVGLFEKQGGAILSRPMSISWTSRDTLELTNRVGGIKLVRIP